MRRFALPVLLLAAACDPGDIGSAPAGSAPPGPGSSARAVCAIDKPQAMRRLTRTEYDYTVEDVLGIKTRPARAFPPDENTFGFATGMTVSSLLVDQYMKAAEAIAKAVDFDRLLPCKVAAGDDACARGFIAKVGRRLYRRPLARAESDRLFSLYLAGKAAGGFRDGVSRVLEAMLQSPAFLYRREAGGRAAASGAVPLTGYERATRLAYFLWRSAPDDAALDAAAAGRLDTAAGVAAEVKRMLADPRAHRGIRDFFDQWLELEDLETISKDAKVYPGFSKAIALDMRRETELFVEDVVWKGAGTLDALLLASHTFVNGRLAKHYGLKGVSGDAFVRVALDPAKRLGLLSQGSLMTIHANANQPSPVHRGKFVRERLLCQTIPNPPMDVVIKPPDLDPNLTTRQRFDRHRADPVCAGCHKLMDPLGFGFEHFDGVGRYRTRDGKYAVDDRGHVYSTQDIDGPFEGVPALARKLASSREVRDCVARQVFRFAMGRLESEARDGCTMAAIKGAFARSGYRLRSLLEAVATSPSFLYRKGRFETAAAGGPSVFVPAGEPSVAVGGCAASGNPPAAAWPLLALLLVAAGRRR